jgi:hypothetical protein
MSSSTDRSVIPTIAGKVSGATRAQPVGVSARSRGMQYPRQRERIDLDRSRGRRRSRNELVVAEAATARALVAAETA